MPRILILFTWLGVQRGEIIFERNGRIAAEREVEAVQGERAATVADLNSGLPRLRRRRRMPRQKRPQRWTQRRRTRRNLLRTKECYPPYAPSVLSRSMRCLPKPSRNQQRIRRPRPFIREPPKPPSKQQLFQPLRR